QPPLRLGGAAPGAGGASARPRAPARPDPHRLGRPAAPDVDAGGPVVHRAHPRAEPRARSVVEATPPAGAGAGAAADLPGVSGWESGTGVGELERAMRSVPLGLEPVQAPAPRASTPPAVPAAPRTTPAAGVIPPPLHRPPTPPSVPVALEAGEESPLAVAARGATLEQPSGAGRSRRLFVVGLGVLLLAFVGTTAWLRASGPPRPVPRGTAVPPGPAIETEVDRLLARAAERIDAH